MYYVKHGKFDDAAKVYLELRRPRILLGLWVIDPQSGGPGLEHCEKILAALLKIPNQTEASKLAIWIGDAWMKINNLVRAEAMYKIAYENSKVKHAKYQDFLQDQTTKFFLRPRGIRKEKTHIEPKGVFWTSPEKSVRIIAAVVFRIK
jgi:hypothetical protein